MTGFRLCVYHSFVWSNFNSLHNSQCITFPIQSYTPSVLIWIIRLLCYCSFCLHHHKSYICYFVASYFSCFDMIILYGIVSCCYQKRFSFSFKVSILVLRFSRVRCHLFVAWNGHRFFSSHFCFLVFVVLLILVLFVMFQMAVISLPLSFLHSVWVFELMHRRYLQSRQDLFLFIYLTHIVCQRHLWDVWLFALSLVFLFSGPCVQVILSSISRMVPSILQEGDSPGVYRLDEIPVI